MKCSYFFKTKIPYFLLTKNSSICLELHRLIRVMWSGKESVVTPYSLFYALWKLEPTFRNYKQQVRPSHYFHFFHLFIFIYLGC